MSDATLHAIHEAIAAHVNDENGEDEAWYLTEWVVVSASAVGSEPDSTAYSYIDSSLAHHHAIGLLDYGKTYVRESRIAGMLEDDE
jgi:hypothetical protein